MISTSRITSAPGNGATSGDFAHSACHFFTRCGEPCFRGLRMAVRDVLEYLDGGMSVDEILADFPDLTGEDIRACLAFAADN